MRQMSEWAWNSFWDGKIAKMQAKIPTRNKLWIIALMELVDVSGMFRHWNHTRSEQNPKISFSQVAEPLNRSNLKYIFNKRRRPQQHRRHRYDHHQYFSLDRHSVIYSTLNITELKYVDFGPIVWRLAFCEFHRKISCWFSKVNYDFYRVDNLSRMTVINIDFRDLFQTRFKWIEIIWQTMNNEPSLADWSTCWNIVIDCGSSIVDNNHWLTLLKSHRLTWHLLHFRHATHSMDVPFLNFSLALDSTHDT